MLAESVLASTSIPFDKVAISPTYNDDSKATLLLCLENQNLTNIADEYISVVSAEDTRGWQQRQQPRPLPVNPGAPRLTKFDYFTVPDMRRLKRMHDDELKVSVGALTARVQKME